jgi:hypothetical protein
MEDRRNKPPGPTTAASRFPFSIDKKEDQNQQEIKSRAQAKAKPRKVQMQIAGRGQRRLSKIQPAKH